MQDYEIVRMFGTGQVTIPKRFRKGLNTKNFYALYNGEQIILKPIIWEKVFIKKELEGYKNIKWPSGIKLKK